MLLKEWFLMAVWPSYSIHTWQSHPSAHHWWWVYKTFICMQNKTMSANGYNLNPSQTLEHSSEQETNTSQLMRKMYGLNCPTSNHMMLWCMVSTTLTLSMCLFKLITQFTIKIGKCTKIPVKSKRKQMTQFNDRILFKPVIGKGILQFSKNSLQRFQSKSAENDEMVTTLFTI